MAGGSLFGGPPSPAWQVRGALALRRGRPPELTTTECVCWGSGAGDLDRRACCNLAGAPQDYCGNPVCLLVPLLDEGSEGGDGIHSPSSVCT
eukprot:3042332-Pyramimonas_sp.AAC.1